MTLKKKLSCSKTVKIKILVKDDAQRGENGTQVSFSLKPVGVKKKIKTFSKSKKCAAYSVEPVVNRMWRIQQWHIMEMFFYSSRYLILLKQ